MFGFRRRTTEQGKPAGNARRRRRWYRRWTRYVVWTAMFLLITGLFAYNYLTQDARVKAFLQRELGHVSGAHVRIGEASFSLLRGLRVQKVSVLTDESGSPQSHLLTADQLDVVLDYGPLLKLRAPRLAELNAQSVELSLYEDADTGLWNFEKLLDHPEKRPDVPDKHDDETGIQTLPAVFLRKGSIRYVRLVHGETSETGRIGVEAMVFPMPMRRFGFGATVLQPGTGRTTQVFGSFDSPNRRVEGRIGELRFDDELRRMMPTQVRQWLERLDVAGTFAIPRFEYKFGAPKDLFDITLAFKDVQSTVQVGQWFNRRELSRREMLRQTIALFDHMGMDQPLAPGELAREDDRAWPRTTLDYLRMRMQLVPLRLKQLQGSARFTSDAVELNGVHFQLLDQSFVMDGRLGGYAGDAAGELRIQTEPGTFMRVPPDRQFMNWMPDEAHRVYAQFNPDGKARLDVKLLREKAGGVFEPTVIVDLFDSTFAFEDFPYPLQRCTGRIVFERDEATGKEMLKIVQLRGHGVTGGPNESKSVEIRASVGPFDQGPVGVDVYVTGKEITSEPEIRKAFPRMIAKSMQIFGPPDYGARLVAAGKPPELSPEEVFRWPEFYGDFTAHVYRDPGPNKGVSTDVTLKLSKASGSLKVFPYPMHDISCELRIIDDDKQKLNELQVRSVKMSQDGGTLEMSGRVGFGDPVMPDLNVKAMNVPIDERLLNALPPTERKYLQLAELKGHVDIVGRVFREAPENHPKDDVDFALALRLHEASIYRDANGPAATNLNGELYLVPGKIDVKGLTGRRGDAQVHVRGSADWETPEVQLRLEGRGLLLDKALRDILPRGAQENWDQQRPEGTTDVDLDYTLKAQANGEPAPQEHIRLALRPKKLSVKSESFAYRLDELGGEVIVDGRNVSFHDFTGRHGPTDIKISGSGQTGPGSSFDLKITARDLIPDGEFIQAVPEALAEILTGLKAGGKYNVDFQTFTLRESQAPARPQRAVPGKRAATQPTTRPIDLDFACTVGTEDGSLDIGVQFEKVKASTKFSGEIRQGELTKLESELAAETFTMAGVQGGNFSATMRRPPYFKRLLIEGMRADLAGGVLAGGVTIETPEDQPSRYAADIVVRNADVMQLFGEVLNRPMRAQLSADLGVEGTFGDAKKRHGRGTVTIDGEGMYEAPVILGLFRLVNFALPVQQGLRNVRLSYVLNGDVVTFDSVELAAPGLRVYGDGRLDMATRRVAFVLNTENPRGLSIPVLGPLAQRLKEELLQIRISGSLDEPEVKATALPTFQATLGTMIEDVQRKKKP